MTQDELPLAGYDEMPVTTLRHRVRALTAAEIEQLLAHEHAHAHRVLVIKLLEHRLDELEQGAIPTPGPEQEPVDTPGHTPAGSPVNPQGPREPGQPTEHGTRSSTGKGIEH